MYKTVPATVVDAHTLKLKEPLKSRIRHVLVSISETKKERGTKTRYRVPDEIFNKVASMSLEELV